MTTPVRRCPGRMPRNASAVSARMPPSPWLSARMMKMTYFTVTVMISAQKISDSTPRMTSGVSGKPPPSVRHSRSV